MKPRTPLLPVGLMVKSAASGPPRVQKMGLFSGSLAVKVVTGTFVALG